MNDISAGIIDNVDNEMIKELYDITFFSPLSYKLLIKVIDANKFYYVKISNRYLEKLGLEKDYAIGKSPHAIYDRATADSINNHYLSCVRQRKELSFSETINLPGGEKHFITYINPVIKDGKVEYIFEEIIESNTACNEIFNNQKYQKATYELLESLFHISMGFTKSIYDNFEKQVDKSLALLGDIFECDLIGIFKFYKDEENARNIKRWCKNEEIRSNLYKYESSAAILSKESLIENNNRSLKYFVLDKSDNSLQGKEIESLIIVPVICKNETWGYIAYFHINEYKEWQEHEVEALVFFGDMFINTFFRADTERQLRILSEKDNLTGLDNRLSLERNMKKLDREEYLPFGFVFLDVNGLKMANDCFGHNIGDNLLTAFAGILKEYAKDYYPTRICGDEFALLCPNLDEKYISKMLDGIREKCNEVKNLPVPLSISVGFAVRTDLDMTISELSEKAESNMYLQKTQESKAVKEEIMDHFIRKTQSYRVRSPEYHQMVIALTKRLACELQLRDIELDKLEKAVHFYDIGYVPLSEDFLLEKNIVKEEAKLLKTHCETGYHIAMAMPFLQPVAEIILSHHENWDGSGYPQGLKGKEIPFISRIIALVDVYVMLVTGKKDTSPLDKGEALLYIENNSGVLFDPMIVEAFLKIMGNKVE